LRKTTRAPLAEERKSRGWSQREVADLLGTTQHNVSRWETGQTTPGPYFRAKLCALFDKSPSELGLVAMNPAPQSITAREPGSGEQKPPSEADSFALWTVPHGRNPLFTGREDLLAWLDQQFFPQEEHADPPLLHRAALTQPQALRGLGGIGKTQVAVEYAHRSYEQGRYTHVLWINAASDEAILSSFMTLAELLPAGIAREETDQSKLVKAIKGWLEQCQQPWLVIFDNADEMSLLQPYLPQRGNGSLLLTTRSHAVGSLAAPIEVENMGLVEGTAFLLQRAQRQQADENERDEATNLVIALDGFPLALDQAGAYIEETGCSFSDYLQLYRQRNRELLARRGKQVTDYPASVATTWSLSFQQVEQANPAAAELLHLCSYLFADAIPEELLILGGQYWPASLQQAVSDPFTFQRLFEDLLRFSLIRRRVKERQISLHRLVQIVQRDRIEIDEQSQWAERVVRAVHAVFPADTKRNIACWPTCLKYLEQVQACNSLIQQYELVLPEAAELLDRAGIYLSDHASYSLAEPLFQRAVAIREMQMVLSLKDLAYLYFRQGRYTLAEETYKRALHILEQNPGMAYRQVTAAVLNNLGNLYYGQGQYKRAEPFYEQALRLREEEVGPDHPRTASPLNNLALLHQELGNYALAETLNLRALRIWEQVKGQEHPDVAFALNGLAELYVKLGKYQEAEPLFRRSIAIREHILGPDHPDVAYPLHGLAELYTILRRYEEARPLLQRALQIWEQGVGPEHDATAIALDALARLSAQGNQEDRERAEALFQRALHIRERQLGPEHPEVARSLSGLAEVYLDQGKDELAERLLQRALAVWEQQLGPEHPSVAHALHDLAMVSRQQGNVHKALSLARRALQICAQTLGDTHPQTIATRTLETQLREPQALLEETPNAAEQLAQQT
jgi:tetratricopeptide (TPR) repeat protein/transcriptional regulator with XRE-family HTH domain